MVSRNTRVSGNKIEYGFWLIFDRDGNVRLTRARGAVPRGARSMFVTATLPLTLFDTPQLRASITLAEGASAAPGIDIKAAADALRGVLGVDIDLKVSKP